MNPDTARNRFTELEGGDPVDHRRVEAFFDDCGPLDIDDIIGEWRGAPLRTGHKGVAQLDGLDWYGKVFRSRFDITPVACRDASGRLTDRHGYGGAGLWRVEFRGVVSLSLVYDRHPIVDHFRRVDEDTLIGVMDGGPDLLDEGKHFYFSLRRR